MDQRKDVKAVSLEGGGEPTISDDFSDWTKALKAAGVKDLLFSTNAVALSDPEFCRKAEKAVDYFTINFPATDPETYRKATRSVKFDMAVKGLENLKALGAERKIRLFNIIFKDNYGAGLRCSLEPACCGARTDYLKTYGSKELISSGKKPEDVGSEAF